MFLSRKAYVASAVVTSLLAPLWGAAAVEPLALTADRSVVAQAMRDAGFGAMTEGRHFLAFDPPGDGRAIEVIGDLTTAQRIVVIVPGSDTTFTDFDRGLGGLAKRAPAVQARVVHDAVLAKSPQSRVAFIAPGPERGDRGRTPHLGPGWTATAAADWIARVPAIRVAGLGHGALPADARHLTTDGVTSHDDYLSAGSSTLAALAELVLSECSCRP